MHSKRGLCFCATLVGALAASAGAIDAADLPRPVAHWKFAGTAEDSGADHLSTSAIGVDFVDDGMLFPKAGLFKGHGEHLAVDAGRTLDFGAGDFSAALWVRTDGGIDDSGDLLSQFDHDKRTGWTLSLRSNAGVTNSQVDVRQLQFGIDNGTEPVFTDEGRPGNSLYGFSMAVLDGNLYVGTCEPRSEEKGRVYRYSRPTMDLPPRWIDCGAPDEANSISSMAVYEGQLYVGSAKYRLGGSSLPEAENLQPGGKIFRMKKPGEWEFCGRLEGAEAVGGMVVFGGQLYATSLYAPAGFFRYEGNTEWTRLESPEGKRTQAMTVFDGALWATSYDNGHIYRFDGKRWSDLGPLEANTQNYSFAAYRGQLYVGSWPSGKVYRWAGEGRWEDTGRLGQELEVMGMLVHNGSLYAGTLPLAELYRFDGDGKWSRLRQLDETPDVKYRRVWTAATFQGKSFWTTLPSGHIHSLQAGTATSWDSAFPTGWQHISAVRAKDRLRLYVGGRQVSESDAFNPARMRLTNSASFTIGRGPGASFRGRMADVRVYREALTPEQVGELAKRP